MLTNYNTLSTVRCLKFQGSSKVVVVIITIIISVPLRIHGMRYISMKIYYLRTMVFLVFFKKHITKHGNQLRSGEIIMLCFKFVICPLISQNVGGWREAGMFSVCLQVSMTSGSLMSPCSWPTLLFCYSLLLMPQGCSLFCVSAEQSLFSSIF